MTVVLLLGALGLAVLASATGTVIRSRQLHLWIGTYARRSLLTRTPRPAPPVHVFVCVCDHYEPAWGGAELAQQRARVTAWVTRYPELADRHRDWVGRRPQHTFFYPEEEYRPEHLDRLAQLCRDGYGDVEVHLHHRNDTSAGLRDKLVRFKTTLHESHGLLRRDASGQVIYAFIHGNWALDNSARGGDWCGVNDELTVLRQTGCYADFTFPSAPSETQPRTINSIYYATDDPVRPKSHDTGVPVVAGRPASGDLLLIQGPLGLNWASRKWGVLPRIENADLSGDNPPRPSRADLWVRLGVHVVGRPEWVFVKLHTHGAQEGAMDALLGREMASTLDHLEAAYNDGTRHRLYYVTAFQMYQLTKQAEAGGPADPAGLLCPSGAVPTGHRR